MMPKEGNKRSKKSRKNPKEKGLSNTKTKKSSNLGAKQENHVGGETYQRLETLVEEACHQRKYPTFSCVGA